MLTPVPDRELPEWLQRVEEDAARDRPLPLWRSAAIIAVAATLGWLAVIGAWTVWSWL